MSATRRTARARATALALLRADDAHPPLRGEVRRALQRGEDPRLPAPLHRRGGGRGRRDAGARRPTTRSSRPTASTATRSRAACRAGAIMAEMFGKRRGLQPRPRRLDAPVRRRARASTAATRSSAAGCRSRSASRSPTRCRARSGVTACFFGEGAVAEGEFHESMNLAALWKLPVLFCCENNLYAMGTALERSRVARPTSRSRPRATRCPPWPRRRHGRARRRGRGAPRGRRRCAAAAGRASSSCAPTASARTRCTTRSSTAARPRSSAGSSAIRSRRSSSALRRTGCSTTTTSSAIEQTIAAEIDDAVAFAEAGHARAGRGPDERFVYCARRRAT